MATMTEEERSALKEELKAEILQEIESESSSVDDLDETEDLEDVDSLPAMKGDTLVRVPLSMLSAGAEAAAEAALDAAENAEDMAELAGQAATRADEAAEAAEEAATGVVIVSGDGEGSAMMKDADNEVTGTNGTALGENNTVSGVNGFAVGEDNEVTGNEASAIGDGNVASGNNSMATGHQTSSVGSSSHTEGKGTVANGDYSHAEGLGSAANGRCSHAEGLNTKTGGNNGAHAQGRYNVGNLNSIDEVGIGSDDENRKNAEETTYEGKKYVIGIGGYDGTNAGEDGVQSLQEFLDGSGNGGNTINVTAMYPKESGYYTLATAAAAVDTKYRGLGRCITYESAQGVWATKQFVGTAVSSWTSASAWKDFGGDGTMKQITVNGTVKQPDANGNVDITIEDVDVDESLDTESTNPVQNAAVAEKIAEIEAGTVFGMDAELSEDETTVTLSLTNKSGAEIASVEIPAGSGGGGGGDSSATKVVIGASLSQSIVKEGSPCVLTWTYDHQYTSGDDAGETTGQKATVEIRLQRGSIQVYSSELTEVSKGTYTLDISKYLQVGTTDVYVRATAVDPGSGNTQTKQAYVNVKVVNLSLSSSYSLMSGLQNGGYQSNESVVIPYTVQGTGSKVVTLYVDGVQKNSATVTKSGTTNGSFSIGMNTLSTGRHTVQIVAEMEASETLTLKSESVYMDIFKAGSSAPLIGTKLTFADGRIFTTGHLVPQVTTGQYEQLAFEWGVYDAEGTPATVTVVQNGVTVQTVNAARTLQTYSNRFTEQSTYGVELRCGATNYQMSIVVTESDIDVGEATYGLLMKLSAAGRSNGESNPAHWENGQVTTAFTGVDWKTSGWTGDALKLMNGAKAVIDYKCFSQDAATGGLTIEAEMKVSNVRDRSADVMSCLDGTKGFEITAEKAMMYTGSTTEVTDEDGNTVSRNVGVGREYGEDMWVKIAFVIGKRADGRLMELYVNGVRSASDIYGDSDNFQQDTPKGITIESDGADVEVRNIRIYGRALTDDEEMDNYIVDRQTLDEMAEMFEMNDVLTEDGRSIDFEKLRAKGKGLMLVCREGGLAPVNAENNKKTDFLCDVHLWLPDGRYVYLKNVYVRIQGTSSTKYPTKNYRIYCAKGESPEMYINGVLQSTSRLPLRIGQPTVKILCPKADYSDSSMAQNTGGAKLWNDLMKSLGFLTPAQEIDATKRTAVDGYPIDVFSAESLEDTPEYYGQYNLNHDKSDWTDILGLTNVEDLDTTDAMAFEFLNNTQPLCLFQGEADLDAQAAEEFDDALEFNHPADTTWATATTAQKNAFKRLWGWVRDCVPEDADVDDISTFESEKFVEELEDYFDKDFLLCWYLFTDYFVNVDQRAKNMILATWDQLVWYFIYYDGDTQIGDRNDSMLAYLYDVTRDTWDSEKSKYAFEGHDSWLWCLVLANLGDDLKAMATAMRAKLTEDKVNTMFDEEQQGNWCGRAFNKSGELKYIKPQTEGVVVNGETVKYPYIYALKGDKKAFRHWFIKNRFALLDAKYETGNYLSDNVDMYMTRQAGATANTIVVKSNDLYYYGYGTNNAPHLQPSSKAEKGDSVTLTFTNAFTVNDPIRLYGASQMAELDMRGSADNLTGDLNLNKCKVLGKLQLQTTGNGSNGWCLVLDQCRQLKDVNLNGQSNAKTGTLSSTELNFGNQTRLESLDARGVNVHAVIFAQGCPLTSAKLGSQIQTLRLEYLPLLGPSGLTLGSWTTVKTLRFSNCPLLNWQTLLARCTNIERVRIEGIDMEDDGSILRSYKTLRGIDSDGNAVDYCAMTGTVRLTSYMSESEYAEMRQHYPELNIVQPEYTTIEYDDSVSDDVNVSNLDNETGYKYGNDYEPSGHILKLMSQRHRVLAKVTRKATTRNITHAGVETVQNKTDGEMTYFPLHDDNSNCYADAEDVRNCSTAKLDGTEGDWMMFEPHKWFKGVNDFLNSKHYTCISSNASRPSIPDVDVLTLEDIQDAGDYRVNYKLMSGKGSLSASYTADSNYAVCRVDVGGYSKVRFPTVPGSNLMGSLFVSANGSIVSTIVVSTLGSKFASGMYLIADVPAGATQLYFTIEKAAEFDKVVLNRGTNVLDMEDEWVEEDAYLTAVVGSSVVGDKLRACVTGGSTTASMSWTDFHYYSMARGMQQIDGMMHNWILNLFCMVYGRRDSQMQCGAGSHSNARTTGTTAPLGMHDTLNTDGVTEGGVESNGLAFYKSVNSNGETVYTRINSTNCLGYEDIYGHKYDMMDCVDMPNSTGNVGKWRYLMPDGSYRFVQGGKVTGYIQSVAHGLYMDAVPVAANGSSSTYYCDYYYYSGSTGRVVYRGSRSAGADGGVSYASASNGASNTYAVIGSRLAFRGHLVKASSVAAYKALTEVA